MRRLVMLLTVLSFLLSTAIIIQAQDDGNPIVHTVKAGENLFRISLRYGVSLNAIADANHINNPNLIFVGQQLTIPGTNSEPPPPQEPSTPVPPSDGDAIIYVVKRGDTLSAIARRFGTSYLVIAANNGIANPNLIYAGQQLLISGTPPPPDNQPPPVNTQEPQPNPVTGFNLGGHVIQGNYPYSDAMHQSGMTWAKRQIRWTRGTSGTAFQGEINAAHERNFRILLSVVGENPNEIAANPAQYYQEFATFLGELAASGADAIEVWNEPNLPREWPASLIGGGQYTQMLSAAYQIIKSRNASTLVISAAPAPSGGLPNTSSGGFNDDSFLRTMSQSGATNFMDCVGIHYNAGAVPPSATSGAPVGSATHYSWYYPSMVNLYSSIFPSKPLCFTEIGYVSGEGFAQPLPDNFSWANGNSVQEQAEWLAAAAAQARNSAKVRLFIVWNVDSNVYLPDDPQAGYAIIRPDGTCPTCNTLGANFGR